MKRIVKETLNNGIIRYRVETNRIFRFIPFFWHTDHYYNYEFKEKAIFHYFSEAESFCKKKEKEVVIKREIL